MSNNLNCFGHCIVSGIPGYIIYGILSGIQLYITVDILISMTIIEDMGEITTVTINAPGKSSLKTTIPISMVRQFGIKQGDQLDWSIIALRGELVMLVRKVGEPLEQNVIPYEDFQQEHEKNKKRQFTVDKVAGPF